jgi:hypothetical protein
MKYDFSGFATKNDLKCSDGRTIRADAFKENDGKTVPLVWQHLHDEPANVLGHALLENRKDGVYAYCKFNDTDSGKNAKMLVEHGDITSLSIFANKLVQKGSDVIHGLIRELSLVMTGANPGALIDNVLCIEHGDGSEETDKTQAIIYTDSELSLTDLEHADKPAAKSTEKTTENPETGKTVKEVFDTLNEEQKNVVYAMITHALDPDGEGGDGGETDDKINHSDEGGNIMKFNVFENQEKTTPKRATLSKTQIQTIFTDAQKCGSLKDSFLQHAQEYGIEVIDVLFPDAKTVTPTPEVIGRNMDWVQNVISGAKHSPFSRIKSTAVDLTADAARAKGYVKASLKKDEVIKLLKRVTTPTTIYKKQKLDRDDILDITDLDVVAWLKAEMRLMLNEEIARAALISDGREPDDPDKINEECVRPIAFDAEMYAHPVTIAANTLADGIIEAIIRARPAYKGTGNPDFYTTESILTDMLLLKDKMGRRLYRNKSELAQELRVNDIIPVEPMETMVDLIGIVVNMRDYTMGADKGGDVSFFDDFNIDYNQFHYLLETRMSGCLTKPKSAIVIHRTAGTLVSPTVPTFVPETGVLTIPTKTGVEYYIDDATEAATAGAQAPVAGGTTVEVVAKPATGYYFPHNFDADWSFVSTLA